MGALLEDRVAGLLRDTPRLTVEEIARKLTARTQTIREILRTGPFEELPRGLYESDRSKVWQLLSYAGDASGRAETATAEAPSTGEPRTDKQFLADVLADRQPHNLNEILRRSFAERACGLTVHSRASDLRKDGYVIETWKDGARGAGSWYRLVATPEEAVAASAEGRSATAASGASTPALTDALGGEGAPALPDGGGRHVTDRSPSEEGAVSPAASSTPLQFDLGAAA